MGEGAEVDLPEDEEEGERGDDVEERKEEVDAQLIAAVDQLPLLVSHQLLSAAHLGIREIREMRQMRQDWQFWTGRRPLF